MLSNLVRVSVTNNEGVELSSVTVPRTKAWETSEELFAYHAITPKFEDVFDGNEVETATVESVITKTTTVETVEVVKTVEVVHAEPAHHVDHVETVVAKQFETAVAVGNVITQAGEINFAGKIRAMIDEKEARDAGFSPKAPIYAIGSQVEARGVANARKSRKEFDALANVETATSQFRNLIKSEVRNNTVVNTNDIRMDNDGRLLVKGQVFNINERVFPALVNRMNIGGAGYLANKCWPELRAINFNAQLDYMNASKEDMELQLRTRTVNGNSDLFAVVSPKYVQYDADSLAEVINDAMPEDARCEVTYDGYRTAFNVLFHSDIDPQSYVAGEIFKCGIDITTDDTGGGGIVGSATVWRNLCLNLIVIDEAKQNLFRILHKGDKKELVKLLANGIALAKSKVAYFLKAWNYASHDNVLEAVRASNSDVPVTVSQALPGLFNGILEKELVVIKGKRDKVVDELMTSWHKEDQHGPTRTSVVNAFTRWAHETNEDPWVADDVQRSVTSLLYGVKGRDPVTLPYLALDSK